IGLRLRNAIIGTIVAVKSVDPKGIGHLTKLRELLSGEISHLNPVVLLIDQVILSLTCVRSWFKHGNFQDVEKVRFGTVLESPLKERNLFRGTVAHRANPATNLVPFNLKSCNASSRHFS